MTNPRAQMEQELRGALRCEVFGNKNVTTYTEQGGREGGDSPMHIQYN